MYYIGFIVFHYFATSEFVASGINIQFRMYLRP